MEVKQLYEILEDEYKEQSVSNSKHWNKLWDLWKRKVPIIRLCP